jgi:hypothetical protein
MQEPLDAPVIENKKERSLLLKIICIVILIVSLLQIGGSFYVTQVREGGYENEWTIFLKIIPFINIICVTGFWFLKYAAYFLFVMNLVFTCWVDYRLSGSFIDLMTIIYAAIAFVMVGQLHAMKRFI